MNHILHFASIASFAMIDAGDIRNKIIILSAKNVRKNKCEY